MEQAGEWFSKAAAKEHKYALYSLGMLYLQGKGVEQDEDVYKRQSTMCISWWSGKAWTWNG